MKFVLILCILVFAGLLYGVWKNITPPSLGVREGVLTPCSSSPNCVSSQAEDPGHYVEPLPYVPRDEFLKILRSLPNAKVTQALDSYIRVEFHTPTLHFIDDVEFSLDPNQERIDVRSGARVGYYDMGVNRERVEYLRRLINNKEKSNAGSE